MGCNMDKALYEPLIVAHKATEGSNFCVDLGGTHFMMALKFKLPGCTPALETQCTRKLISSLKRLHFNGLSFRLYSLNQLKTTCSVWRCSSTVHKKMFMSSR